MTRATARVRVRACAKINLTLRVLGIRADGYHELRTTFQSLALHDTLTFAAAPGPFRIISNDPDCPTDQSNLVWKAAARLWNAAGRPGDPYGVTVRITKRVPVQAGLGGGSSDAAAALRALRALWGLEVADERLEDIGRDLGADVAFFLTGGTVLGVERGDLLFPLVDAPRAWVVLARPDFGVGTKDAYVWWDAAWHAVGASAAGSSPGRGSRKDEWTNDLQGPVVERHPRILRLVRSLTRSGAQFAAMSGSGSAVFGLFPDKVTAERAAASLRSRTVSTWVTRTTTRDEHERASGLARVPPHRLPLPFAPRGLGHS
ncbi:MAG: 4-(cytidine 5'-diphospho)-2-C-methyl-D-erythritol kinase [Vicinamibacterales bacterium]